MAWFGMAGFGMGKSTLNGSFRFKSEGFPNNKVWQGAARLGNAELVRVWRGVAGQGEARQDMAGIKRE